MKTISSVRPGLVLVALVSTVTLVSGCGDVTTTQGSSRGAALVLAEQHVAQERAQDAQSARLTRQAEAQQQRDAVDRALTAQSARLTRQAEAQQQRDAVDRALTAQSARLTAQAMAQADAGGDEPTGPREAR